MNTPLDTNSTPISAPTSLAGATSLNLMTPSQIAELSARIEANADLWIQCNRQTKATTSNSSKPTPSKTSTRSAGRPAKRIQNPLCGFIGPKTEYGRYPYFSQEIVEGIARLDWHDRPIGKGGSSKPLSVRSMMMILESLETITTEGVAAVIGTKERQAQRYVKAIELAISFLMKSRPKRLVFDMDLPEDEFVNAAYSRQLQDKPWELEAEMGPASAEDIAILRRDLGDDAFQDWVINAAYYEEDSFKDLPDAEKGRRGTGSSEAAAWGRRA